MPVCGPCQRGSHTTTHSTWTGKTPGTTAGADAGCANMVDGQECSCTFTVPNRGGPARCPTCGQTTPSLT